MKKALKVTALFFSSAFLLAACGQDKKEETTAATGLTPKSENLIKTP